MMPGGLLLFRAFGIPVRLHASWFLFAGLITLLLGSGPIAAAFPGMGGGAYLLAFLFVVLLYAGILAHELAHALVARDIYGVRILGISLYLLGGVAAMEDGPPRPAAEFWITIAGPAMSIVVGAAFLALGWWRAPGLGEALWLGLPMTAPHRPTDYLLWVVGGANVALGVFNMLPAFPLDGGRVLRAIVWAASGRVVRATRIAGGVSRIVAFAMLGFAIGTLFEPGGGFSGLWLLLLSFFVLAASRQQVLLVEVRESLRDLTARQIMAPPSGALGGSVSLEAAAEHLLGLNLQVVPVVDVEGDFLGLVGVNDFARVPRRAWPTTTLAGLLAMQPEGTRRALARLSVAPNAPGMAVYQRLAAHPLGRVPVLEGHRLVGTITRQRLENELRRRIG